ncbi:ABC transporter permease subunit [Klebsiella quasipneumoniae]|uniref:ABC transporter permease subunit n=1 Tax=Klebsiella quasipneumoniae TaxID=1463165 RepID=UPI00388EED00
MLIQLVRMLFGAQNVRWRTPPGLRRAGPAEPDPAVEPAGGAGVRPAGAVHLAHPEPHLPWNERPRRDAQNRAMAACCGVPTGRCGYAGLWSRSGIAGLGGVALSQLGNVGPELGQGYIIDSFLVVVLGGVGQLAGSVAAAFGLGIFNKILEPQMGAVLGKILILVMIILFIQKRPQGLFALKGRVID